MIRFLVPALLLLSVPAFAQTQPPTVTEAQQVNNGIASTMQFLSALKNTIEQKDAYLDAYKAELAKVTKERDDVTKERDALKTAAEPHKP